MRTRTGKLLLGSHLLLGAVALPALAATPCEQLKDFRMDGQAIEIDSAAQIAAGPMAARAGGPPGPPVNLPAHCRVEGTIDKRTGRDGKPYAIGFTVAMPAEWNGRFFFQGGGGLNGTIQPPLGGQFTGEKSALARGFAVVSTDSGHKGAVFDDSFLVDQEAQLNFLYAGNGKVTVVAKQIVAQHYGRPADYSYFMGCSTGGREAMMMSQRFPTYFDGIVSGDPTMRTGYSNMGLRWASTALNAIAPKDDKGEPITNQALSDGDRKLIHDRMLEACDALDGAKDGLVFAAPSCKFDPAVLACKGAKTDSCLTIAQVDAVKKVMGGPRTSDGRQPYPGYLWDTGVTSSGDGRGLLAGVLAGTPTPEGAKPGMTIDIDAEAAAEHTARHMVGDSSAWTNFSTFTGHGGKLIFFHGVSDAWLSAADTIQYYERLSADNGPAPVSDWSRLFLVPGMAHCNGGERTVDQFNMLDPIMDWVEKGISPERIVATGRSMPGESRPLCPYPARAQYHGAGDPKDAASYSCTLP